MDSESVSSSDEEQVTCPLCYEPMDDTDLTLFPCPCNFQICLWCLKYLVENNRPCPNCRRAYDEKNYRTIELKKEKRHPKVEETHVYSSDEAHDMQAARVIQKNLVYVIGLPIEASPESIIRRQDMFGQYGRLNKIVVNSRNPICDKSSTCGVYLTYENNQQALDCIRAVDGFTYCHRLLKASYGTTKYCYNFIKGQKCNNPDCLFLHRKADKEDCFTKDEMVERQLDFYRLTHPGHGSQWDERLQKYIYNKPSEENYTSLPPPPRESSVKSRKAKTVQTSVLSPEMRAAKSASVLSSKQKEISTPPVLFSLHTQQCSLEGTKWNEHLSSMLDKSIPYTFENVAMGIQGSMFGLNSVEANCDEKIDIDRLLRCGSLLGNEPQDSTQRSGYQLAGFPITPDS